MEWIKVSDRLPKANNHLLFYSKNGGIAEGIMKSNEEWLQYRWSAIVSPTHWMPLPQPPKES